MAKERCSAYVPRVIGPFPENVEDLDVIGGYLPDLGEVPIPDNQDILMFIEEEKRANGVRMIECLTVEDVNRLLEMVPNRRNPMNAFLLHLQRPIMRNWIEPFRRGQMTFLLRLQEDGSVLPFPINREAIFELFDRDDARPREIEEMDVPPQVKEQARAEWREEFDRRLQGLIDANRQNVPAGEPVIQIAEAPVDHEEEIRRDVEILRRLIFDENYDQLRELIRHGIDFDTISEILPELFQNGRRNIIEMFLDGGVMHEEILYIAARRGDIDIVRRCIELGMRYDRALNFALRHHIEIVRLLIRNGFKTAGALMFALEINDIELVRTLLENGVEIVNRDRQIINNNRREYTPEIVRLLDEHNVLENNELVLAIRNQDIETIRRLIRERIVVNENSDPIYDAIRIGNINILALLLANNIGTEDQRIGNLITAIDINHQMAEMMIERFRIFDQDALHEAVFQNLHRIVELLLDAGVHLGPFNNFDATNLDILELLLERGELPDNMEFYIAVRRNNIDVVRRLIEQGQLDIRHTNIIKTAVTERNVDMVRLLLQNHFGDEGLRIDGLFGAIKLRNMPMIRMMVEEFNIRSNEAIEIAVEEDPVDLDIVRYLTQQGMFNRGAFIYVRDALHNQELLDILRQDPRNVPP